MATYDNIVTDGLVFQVDAVNKLSYIDQSSTVTDTVGLVTSTLTNMNLSLQNGVFDFDGSDDYIDTNSTLGISSGNKSFDLWVNFTVLSTSYLATDTDGSANGYGVIVLSTGAIRIFTDPSLGNKVETTTGIITSSSWFNISATFDSGVTGGKIYVNGELVEEGNLGSGFTGIFDVRFNGRWTTGTGNSGTSLNYNGFMALANIYNKALTAEEVKKNYEATKHRFH